MIGTTAETQEMRRIAKLGKVFLTQQPDLQLRLGGRLPENRQIQ
jgi:hypothetical protein